MLEIVGDVYLRSSGLETKINNGENDFAISIHVRADANGQKN